MNEKPTIFIVEDSRVLSEIMSFHLKRKFNGEVFCFEDGDGLIDNINEMKHDVLILDYNLNSKNLAFKNGLDVLIHIRTFSEIPVVVFSGQNGKDKAIEFLSAGANCYVSKKDDDFMDNLLMSLEEII